MKRSEINALIESSKKFVTQQKFHLPLFGYWTPEEWRNKGHEADEIRDCLLGWDVSDMAGGNFSKVGLVLFTIRNGHPTNRRYPKTYCEKILIQEVGQQTPMHFHWRKAEDIINRAGGDIAVELYNASKTEALDDTDVSVSVDGVRRVMKAGAVVVLKPGESICLTDHVYHRFTGRGSKVLLGEVSTVNDDKTDNRFLEPLGRFPKIVEDEPPVHLLCNEYPPAR